MTQIKIDMLWARAGVPTQYLPSRPEEFGPDASAPGMINSLNRNVSALLREEVERLLHRRSNGSAYEKAERLCGVIKGGPKNAATSKEYLKQYAQKGAH